VGTRIANAAHALRKSIDISETEVVALIARGYSNREIAERLVITTRTAETHVTNCMTKPGLHSRAQLAAWSVRHGTS
jgi:DNA-binding NarL/FixJ family response regulator